jgi:hypothetical protein
MRKISVRKTVRCCRRGRQARRHRAVRPAPGAGHERVTEQGDRIAPRGRPTAVDVAHLVPDVSVALTPSLAEALIERAGIERDAESRWVAGDGRRTSAISEALIWALVAIADE